MYRNILLPTDGSEYSQKGVEHGLQLAKYLDSKVSVVTVIEPYHFRLPTTAESWAETQNQFADSAINAANEAAARIGVPVTVHRLSGESPADEIISLSKKLGCDLIVMASHGRRGLSKLLLGSHAAKVVHEAKIPVLVVR